MSGPQCTWSHLHCLAPIPVTTSGHRHAHSQPVIMRFGCTFDKELMQGDSCLLCKLLECGVMPSQGWLLYWALQRHPPDPLSRSSLQLSLLFLVSDSIIPGCLPQKYLTDFFCYTLTFKDRLFFVRWQKKLVKVQWFCL